MYVSHIRISGNGTHLVNTPGKQKKNIQLVKKEKKLAYQLDLTLKEIVIKDQVIENRQIIQKEAKIRGINQKVLY